MKILILGGNGQLGCDVRAAFEKHHDVHAATHDDGDICNPGAMRTLFDAVSPDCVINTAAMHHVEECEKNPSKAYETNALASRQLAELCREGDIPFVHISTDYVFDGKKGKPYLETDAAFPLNVYGNTKQSGENYILSTWHKGTVVRVGGIYGQNPCRAKGGLNFVQLMLKLAKERPQIRVVDDETVTPTPTAAIAAQLVHIVENGVTGLVHVTCRGECSWYEFARNIFELCGIKTDLQKARPGEFPAKVARPSYSVLENRKLQDCSLDVMPHWLDGLKNYIYQIKKDEA